MHEAQNVRQSTIHYFVVLLFHKLFSSYNAIVSVQRSFSDFSVSLLFKFNNLLLLLYRHYWTICRLCLISLSNDTWTLNRWADLVSRVDFLIQDFLCITIHRSKYASFRIIILKSVLKLRCIICKNWVGLITELLLLVRRIQALMMIYLYSWLNSLVSNYIFISLAYPLRIQIFNLKRLIRSSRYHIRFIKRDRLPLLHFVPWVMLSLLMSYLIMRCRCATSCLVSRLVSLYIIISCCCNYRWGLLVIVLEI